MNRSNYLLFWVYGTFFLMLLLGSAIVFQIFNIQFFQRGKWLGLEKKQNYSIEEVRADRGNIYSSNGAVMATSLPYYKLAMDASVVTDELLKKEIDSLAAKLSEFFKDASPHSYKEKIIRAHKEEKQFIYLNDELVNFSEMKTIRDWPLFREGRFKSGLIFEKSEKRIYPFGDLAIRTLGYMHEDSVGAGLEYSFNNYLHGVNGKVLMQRIAGGQKIPVNDIEEVEAQDGYDIITTIDVNIQDVVQTALQNAVEKHHAKYGVAIVMDVKTGEIKALANVPETFNYAVAEMNEPGSTFKLISAISLLEDNYVKLTDTIDTKKGKWRFYNRIMEDHDPLGLITFQEAFEKSSNVAFSRFVNDNYKNNPQKFLDHLKKIGILESAGSQIGGEPKPFIIPPKRFKEEGTALPWLAVGYNVQLTPLQILTFYNAVANDGKMIRPVLVKEVKHLSHTIKEYQTETIREKICSDETLQKIRTMMEGVIEHNGTAQWIKNSKYKIAGKTGTAQKVVNGKYQQTYQASFVGYFPADNPQYSCFVLIDEPSEGIIYGGLVSAPVFKEISDNLYAKNFDIHKSLNADENLQTADLPLVFKVPYEDVKMIYNKLSVSSLSDGNNPAKLRNEWVSGVRNDKSIQLVNQVFSKSEMPNVWGMTMKDALYVLENIGLKVYVSGHGKVKSQSIKPGEKIQRGYTVFLELEG